MDKIITQSQIWEEAKAESKAHLDKTGEYIPEIHYIEDLISYYLNNGYQIHSNE